MTAGSPTAPRLAWLDNPRLQGVAHLATALTALLTAVALFFAASQLRASADQERDQALLQREIAANGSWERYMELASEKPEFAVGLDYATLSIDQKTSYAWFVERMLFAGEQILSFDANDRQWQLTIHREAQVHQPYLASDEFISGSYCAYTHDLRKTLVEAFGTDAQLSRRLAVRDRECSAQGYAD